MNNKIILWDMDRTLGFFEHLGLGKASYMDSDCIQFDFGTKEGIEYLLAQTKEEGFDHYVTTSAKEHYVMKALKITDMKKYFSKIYCKDRICQPLGIGPKNYGIILDDLGIRPEQAKSDVLIIGNSLMDVPHKNYGIVSMIDEHQWQRKSELTMKMINLLMDIGKRDFNKGFQELYLNSEKLYPEYRRQSKIGKIIIEGNVELHLKLMEERENYSRSPIFQVIKADTY